jgi:hypothetical protein
MPPPTLGLAIAIPQSHGCVLECAFYRQTATDHVIDRIRIRIRIRIALKDESTRL